MLEQHQNGRKRAILRSKYQMPNFIKKLSNLDMYFSLICSHPLGALVIERRVNSHWVRNFTCVDDSRPSLRSLSLLLLGEWILQCLQRWTLIFSIQKMRLHSYRCYNFLQTPSLADIDGSYSKLYSWYKQNWAKTRSKSQNYSPTSS